jgi:hypothetical protein
MLRSHLSRGLLALAAITCLCSIPLQSQAALQKKLIIVGDANDAVAISHPTPEYPAECQRMRIQGHVQVRIYVEHGRTLRVTATSKAPLLAGVSSRWVRSNWRFRPTANGIYVLPIVYQLTS